MILTNVLRLSGNPYLDMWNDAVIAAGGRPDWLSPRRLAAAALRNGRTWVHIQWPERVLGLPTRGRRLRRAARLVALCAIARVLGFPVLVTAHNVWSHEGAHPRLERALWWALARLTSDLHLLSAAGATEVLEAHPGLRRARRHVIPHGDFGPRIVPGRGRARVRAELEVPDEAIVVVTFGALKAYKGVGDLIRAFEALPDADARLVIAGRLLDGPVARDVARAQLRDPRIVVRDAFLDEVELQDLIRASDVVALPYRKVLNSSSAMLALTLERPVVVPSTPTFSELAGQVGSGWVRLFDGTLTPVALARQPAPAAAPDLRWCSWAVVDGSLRRLLGSRHARSRLASVPPARR